MVAWCMCFLKKPSLPTAYFLKFLFNYTHVMSYEHFVIYITNAILSVCLLIRMRPCSLFIQGLQTLSLL